MKKVVVIIWFSCLVMLCRANTYYVSPSGNDANSGLSSSEAWQTINKVEYTVLQAGDIVLFEGGQTFTGMLYNASIKNATADNPITFGSYGVGKAIMTKSTNETGFYIENTGNIIIKDLIFQGDGHLVTSVWCAGIYFYLTKDATATMGNISVENCEISDYGGWGILFEAESPDYGYNHVKVKDCLLHDNGIGGLQMGGYWDSIAQRTKKINTDIYFGYTKAYHNLGRRDYKTNWSGTGILMAGVDGGIIEHCEANDNGNDNGSTYAGPVGIFMGESNRVTIQYCKSHDNHGGLGQRDGGGFDLDGGAAHSVIQYCESYDNDGAGYGLYEWETKNNFTDDTIRYNTSTNDGRISWLYGAISFWGVNQYYRIYSTAIYGNTINMDKAGVALRFLNSYVTNVKIFDNIFCLTSPAVYSNTIPSGATVTNSTFPCTVLSLRENSFNVKRIR